MKLLIIMGFLGSGKTTLLLQIARRLSEASLRIAIIENEIGDIGIDGDYLEREGLSVQELFGGCICCTLATSLIETMLKLEQRYNPDIVILEPTGAAVPGAVTANLNNFPSKLASIQVVTILDAIRYEMLIEMMEPLLTAQIQVADMVVINKIDQVETETIKRIIQDVDRLNQRAKINAVSAEDQASLDTFMGHLL
ncbi:MAG: cobalamin biosynthesis protein P47K [Deltaproteobacteria bacterium]|nr:cobalamin biosynthesis protein P47K [Deltaproteobacteria bacterium]